MIQCPWRIWGWSHYNRILLRSIYGQIQSTHYAKVNHCYRPLINEALVIVIQLWIYEILIVQELVNYCLYILLPRVSPWSINRNWITLLYPSYIKSSAEVSVVVVINWGRSVHSPARRPRHRIHQHAMWTSRVQDHKDNEEHCTECETLFQDTHLNHDWQWVLLQILIVTWWFGCWLKSTEWL